jgi:hypothetical protein
MLRKTALFIALCMVTSFPAFASGADMSGTWVASAMGSRLEAHVKQSGTNMSGVAYVYDPFGKRDTYHFKGIVNGNQVTASHHEGHVFTGTILGPGQVTGTLRTRGGHQLAVSASRQ